MKIYKVVLSFIVLGFSFIMMIIGNSAFATENGLNSLPQFERGLKELFPSYSTLEKMREQVYRIKSADGKELGELYLELIPEKEKKIGYAGPIEIAVAFRDGRTAGVLIGKNEETPGFLRRLVRRGFLKGWNGATLKELQEKQVDAVSGATMSSEAIADSVRKLSREHQARLKQ